MQFRSFLVRALAVAASISFIASAAYAQQIQVNKDNRTLAITATDTASAMADVATVHVGFVVYGANEKAAYAEASERSNAIARALAAAGIAKADLQSESQSLTETPPYELEKLTPEERAQRRFQVQQSWTAKTKADDAAEVLNTAVRAGANQSGQIDWSVADENALEAQAAGKALARARAIAAQMAHGLGIQLGELIYASNQAAEGQRPMAMARGMVMKAETAPEAAPLAINPRKIERSATVYAVFSIE